MFKIISENMQRVQKYTYEELLDKKRKGGSIVGKAIKCTLDDFLIVDLGNDILGEIHITDFEYNTKETSKVSLISKVGHPVEAIVEEVYGDKVILNRAKLQKEYKEKVLPNELIVGKVYDVEVYSVAPFGVFVDMGKGVLALLPIDNIALSKLTNISEVFYSGKAIKVIYTGTLNGGFVLSHKELLGTWDENFAEFKEGEIVQGIVRDIKEYGAFIEIAPNLSGLAELPEYPISIGDSVIVNIKKAVPNRMKIKLHIINKTSLPYEVKYSYKIKDGIVSHWVYNPNVESDVRRIESFY